MSQGGTWKRAEYPDIDEERRIDIGELEEKNGLSKSTTWHHMNKLEGAGVFVRRYTRSDRHMQLAFMRAMPLLAFPERIVCNSSRHWFQNETLMSNYILQLTFKLTRT